MRYCSALFSALLTAAVLVSTACDGDATKASQEASPPTVSNEAEKAAAADEAPAADKPTEAVKAEEAAEDGDDGVAEGEGDAPAATGAASAGGEGKAVGALGSERTKSGKVAAAPAAPSAGPAVAPAAAEPPAADEAAAPPEAKSKALAARADGGGKDAKSAGLIEPTDLEAPLKAAPDPADAKKIADAAAAARRDAERERRRRKALEEERKKALAAQANANKLTAGEWSDLENWSFWRSLFDTDQSQGEGPWQQMERTWGFNTKNRQPVLVKSPEGPIADAEVSLVDANQNPVWQGRTDVAGQANVFTAVFGVTEGPLSLVVRAGRDTTIIRNLDMNGEPIVVDFLASVAPSNVMDIMFVVDTTGSMGDELRYLQGTLESVIKRVQAKNGQQLKIRVSVNFYRDIGDQYVTKLFPFSTNVRTVVNNLRDQTHGGGGDFPEAVDVAMDDALSKHDWSPGARTRLLFLVLDAPPHSDPQVIDRMHELTQKASAMGVHVIPLAGSGINKDTEFLMRFMAVLTGGTYVFLTDDSGIGGGHVKPTIGQHRVEILDQLLVRVINKYLG